MIAWMLYSVCAGALVVIAARAAEWIARVVRVPARWVWVAALGLMVVLPATAPLRRPVAVVTAPAVVAQGTPTSLDERIDLVSKRVPDALSTLVVAAWIVANALIVVAMLGVHARLRRARRGWPLTDLHGTRVRLSPDLGPVVVGFSKPEIVVPRWLLERSSDEQRLIVAHEREHVLARDTVLLGAGCAVAALMPWNPAAWYALSRLRLVVELDCDARVLERGVEARSYGSLLIDLAARAPRLRFGVAALGGASHLHQRILAMRSNVPKFARLRGGVAALLGGAALIAACEAKMPTATEVQQMDVASAELRLVEVPVFGVPDSTEYYVDRVRVSRAVALGLKADEIGSIEVTKGEGTPKIFITKRESSAPAGSVRSLAANTAAPDTGLREVPVSATGLREVPVATTELRDVPVPANGLREVPVAANGLREVPVSGTVMQTAPAITGNPMVLIDGVRSDMDAFRRLDRSSIESVEVLKGPSAVKTYGEAGANGVISIKTKKGSK